MQEKSAIPPSGNSVNNNINQTGTAGNNNTNQITTGGTTGNNTGGFQTTSGGTTSGGTTTSGGQKSSGGQTDSGGTTSKAQTGTSSSSQTTNNKTNNQVNNQSNNQNNDQANNNSNTNNESNNINLNLKELHLNVEGINPAFNANTTQYYLVVSNFINDIEVVAIPEDASAGVEVTGNTNLVMGNNEIFVKVISSDGSASKTYAINVSKTEDRERGNANLENLAIENIDIIPEFNSDIFKYTAEVGSNIENLNILAVPQRENARSGNRRKQKFTIWR